MDKKEELKFSQEELIRIKNDIKTESTFNNHERYATLMSMRTAMISLIAQLEAGIRAEAEEEKRKEENERYLNENMESEN